MGDWLRAMPVYIALVSLAGMITLLVAVSGHLTAAYVIAYPLTLLAMLVGAWVDWRARKAGEQRG